MNFISHVSFNRSVGSPGLANARHVSLCSYHHIRFLQWLSFWFMIFHAASSVGRCTSAWCGQQWVHKSRRVPLLRKLHALGGRCSSERAEWDPWWEIWTAATDLISQCCLFSYSPLLCPVRAVLPPEARAHAPSSKNPLSTTACPWVYMNR